MTFVRFFWQQCVRLASFSCPHFCQ